MNSVESVRHPLLVLVVDPDADVRVILTLLLKHRGHMVVATEDPSIALELARAWIPDVVIGEHPLRLRSGRLLCEQLQQDQRTREIPFLALTTRTSREAVIEARRTHPAGVVPKPVLPSEILKLLEALPAARSPVH